ncbi:DUF3019 domain-containing protein [Shewanella colwelliana]|uniref:DUF3019 domain-containing protein n=1 Tax=Shewanella colwelliana TaxID=23 RepID=UPI0004B8CD1B|nr:DUF3019 domain-containing protein [Shewanella colwelliana]
MLLTTYRLLLAVFVLISFFNSALAADNDSEASITLSPQFCITSAEEQSCDLTVVLNWEIDTPTTVCIMSDHESLTKWCADSPTTHSLSLAMLTDKDVQFVMVDKETHQTLAGVKLKVTPTAEPQVRRRYRNPWSLF